jgi:hypothetical protein
MPIGERNGLHLVEHKHSDYYGPLGIALRIKLAE